MTPLLYTGHYHRLLYIRHDTEGVSVSLRTVRKIEPTLDLASRARVSVTATRHPIPAKPIRRQASPLARHAENPR
jgi:hypothetical protein